MTITKAEADAADALWRRLTIPEKERRKLLDEYRDAVLHAAAERIRSFGDPADHWAANLVDANQACDCGELTCECGCQTGEQPEHWTHSRSCGTQRRS